jgi:hypothetical protein
MKLREFADQNVYARKYRNHLKDFANGLHAVRAKAYAFARQALLFATVATIRNHVVLGTTQVKRTLDPTSRTPLLSFLKDYRDRER